MTLLTSRFFFFEMLIVLSPVARVRSFRSLVMSHLHDLILFFFFFRSFFSYSKSFTALVRGKADFGSLALGSFRREESLAGVSWVCTFEAILLEKQWPLKQRISKSQTMVLDLRPTLTSALIAPCSISLKLTASRPCCSISILMEGLRPFQK